jgi:hypothetical protein
MPAGPAKTTASANARIPERTIVESAVSHHNKNQRVEKSIDSAGA